MSEADEVFVLDTGSTDRTADLLQELGAKVTKDSIIPWRFDTARNRSLDLVPMDTDICVCTDLDEVFHPGWRKLLESAWQPETGPGLVSLYLVLQPRWFRRRGILVPENSRQKKLPVDSSRS